MLVHFVHTTEREQVEFVFSPCVGKIEIIPIGQVASIGPS